MSDLLVLMRHGKAQRYTDEVPDIDRPLNEAGKRALYSTLPESLGLMPRGATAELWSSPATRALQTARIMLEACEQRGMRMNGDIVTVESLWSQDAQSFLDMVRRCGSDMVIAVGHNPFMEDIAAKLTGSRMVFATGAFAAVRLHDERAAVEPARPARLLWFVQGPSSQRWKTIVQLERIVADATDDVLARRDAFFENPGDTETMHKFRVSVRTLRSLIAFIRPWQSSEQNKAAQADLKAIVSQTSRLRELDVLAEQASSMDDASNALVEFCKAKADFERERVIASLASKEHRKRFDRVEARLHDIRWRKRVNAAGLEASEIRQRFDSLVRELEADISALDIADAEKTHDIRKSAKRMRYDAEKFKPIIGEDAPAIAKAMTAHQDNLGAVCDARVNIDIINSFAKEDVPEPLAWDLALLRAKNETFLYTTLRTA